LSKTRTTLRIPTEVALTGTTLAALAGFRRMFDSWDFFPSAAVSVIAAHALQAALRRRRTPLLLAALIHVVAGVVLLSWLYYGGTTGFGLPTGATWDVFVSDLRQAVQLFRDVQAPTAAVPGFLVGTAIALYITPFLSDWSAFRLWAPFEALLPAFGLFVFGAMFGADILRITVTVLFLAASLGFLLLYRTARQEASASWVRGDASRGSRALLRSGASLAGVAMVGGLVVAPFIPGARQEALVDWKELGGRDGTRVTVSPLVEIQSKLVEQRDIEVFTVTVDKDNWRSYWRLTALDSFDGRVWRSSKKFSKTKGPLEDETSSRAGTEVVTQEFRITGLAQIWLPAAFEPQRIDVSTDQVVRWEPSTSTLIVENDRRSSDGLVYRVTSTVPAFDEASLRAVNSPPPADVAENYLELPEGFSNAVRDEARRVTAGATTPFEHAIALERYFRETGFRYSLEVQNGHGGDRLEEFVLQDKVGYCEQFAGSYAAMARSVGLPARVAVGFTPGDPDPLVPNTYRVKGKHAHAWPEVYISGYGWVLFEPTPNRGAPGAGYTGVAEQQDSDATLPSLAPDPATDTLPEIVPPTPGGGPNIPLEELAPDSGGSAGGGAGEGDGGLSGSQRVVVGVLAGLAVLMLSYLGAVALVRTLRRQQRRRAATSANARIDLAWREVVEHLGPLGLVPDDAETPAEFAHRATRRVRLEPADVDGLASLTVAARYSGSDAEPAAAAHAGATAAAVKERVEELTSVSQRVGYHYGPRALASRQMASRRARRQRAYR
jgi:transglutaminase-like putative cysteine protease